MQWQSHSAMYRADVYYSPSSTSQQWQKCLSDRDHPQYVDFKLGAELLYIQKFQWPAQRYASIVYQPRQTCIRWITEA